MGSINRHVCMSRRKMFFRLMTLLIIVVALVTLYFVQSGNLVPNYKATLMVVTMAFSVQEQTQNNTQRMCPALSPYLKGALELTFDPDLTLDHVKMRNPSMHSGLYQPETCKAQQTVAIIIPFRKRERHLLYLLNHLHPLLQRQQLEYGIYIIHQGGNTTFNRAKLLNVGYLEALKQKEWECFIFHDVDLLPENDLNLYLCDKEPKQLVVGRNTSHYKIVTRNYFGGGTALSREQFAKVNGYSNSYWGWGAEDDDLRRRVVLHQMKVIQSPPDIARYTMIFHMRDTGNEPNDKRLKLLRNVSKTWKRDGLNSCSYKLLSIEQNPLYINITVDIGEPSI
uniref:Beta-1,4-galactosyltransferase n=1 Tax=Leptobrachium leishanense TaxID=445787 RepID=A0A8C5N314_9ANUR